MGTLSTSACAATKAPNDEAGADAWPLDLNDDQMATIADIAQFIPSMNSAFPSVNYDVRFDLNMDGKVSTLDLSQYALHLNEHCP